MKHILLSICCLLCCGSAFSQSRVSDFGSAMTSSSTRKKIFVMDVNYNNSAFSGVDERWVRQSKPSKSVRDKYMAMGHVIDSLGLINYQADTLYVLSQYYIPAGSVSEFFKVRTQNSPFYFIQDTSDFIKDASGEYVMKYLGNQYDSHTDPRVIASDSLFYNTIYSWDIDKLLQMIKASGGPLGSENFMSATRIIIQDNQVIKKDIVNFMPALHWHLD